MIRLILAPLILAGCAGIVVDPVCPAPRLTGCDGESAQSSPIDREKPDPGKHPNSGRGNGSEGNPDKDPGNSGGHNKGGD